MSLSSHRDNECLVMHNVYLKLHHSIQSLLKHILVGERHPLGGGGGGEGILFGCTSSRHAVNPQIFRLQNLISKGLGEILARPLQTGRERLL